MAGNTVARFLSLVLLALTGPILFPQTPSPIAAAADTSFKRGLSLSGNTDAGDYAVFLSQGSPISWYYTWSPYPSTDLYGNGGTDRKSLAFVPMIHGIDSLDGDLEALSSVSNDGGQDRYLLTFNEPDVDTGGGGSSLDPKSAAREYAERIAPLREEGGWKLAHPAVSGSPRGLKWLEDFREACDGACPFDFVAAHWYGDAAGLRWWLDELRGFYETGEGNGDSPPIWVTELGLPGQDAVTTENMQWEAMSLLDSAADVERYAWFGLFRQDSSDAQGWTGDGVALLDSNGGLTPLGVQYMGGEGNGFDLGQGTSLEREDEDEDEGTAARVCWWAMGGAMVASLAMSLL